MKYDFKTPLSAKRKARIDQKEIDRMVQAQYAFNERHRAGKRSVAYGTAPSADDLARAFARSEGLHLEGVITNPARLPELLELIEAREHVDKLLITHPDAMSYRNFIRLLTTARTAGVEVIALGNINFSRRIIFGVLS